MEYINFLVLVVLLLMILFLRYALLDRMDRLEKEVQRLREEAKVKGDAPASVAAPVPPAPTVPQTPPSPSIPPVPQTPRETEPYRPSPRPAGQPAIPPAPSIPPAKREARVETRAEPTDWEKFIGENLISKIGIAILVLAIGFFVKYAIDNDWIGPVGRVGVGLLCGAVLIGIAHRMRNEYKAFSSVLIGGGIAALYFTIALAFHQYHLLGRTTAFVLMLAITAFAVLVSVLYDREELAIIALVGGFVTPFLVSNGSEDYQALFTYLLILNTGLLVIAYRKAWRLLNGLAFGFTVVLFGSWLLRLPDPTPATVYYRGVAFATAFYALFFVVNIARTIRENKQFIASDFIILLLNTALYFGVTLYFLSLLGLERYKGLYCAVMGVIHIALSYFLFRKQSVDKNILYLLIGLTLSFVSLTAPLQLHGHYITLFWASESVLLYWLYLRSGLKLIGYSTRLVWAAMLVSLVWDWFNIYVNAGAGIPIVFNKALMTGLYCGACCFALFRLLRRSRLAGVAFFTGMALCFLAGALELSYQFGVRLPDTDIGGLYLGLYAWIFFLLFTIFNSRVRRFDLRALNLVLLGLGLAGYLLYLPNVLGLQEQMLQDGRYSAHFLAHWAGAVVVVAILYRLTALHRRGQWRIDEGLFSWAVAITAVIVISAEGQMLVNSIWYPAGHTLSELRRVYDKTGLPILWGICSFVCMWLGMRNKFRPLRIFSLVLFMVTLLKLFLFDIRNIPVAGKIAAFFCLGILLLVVSFMYQRLKKIITQDEAT